MVLGNPDLKPETSKSTHLALDYKLKVCFYSGVSLYHHFITNKIDYTSLFEVEPRVATAKNLDKVWRAGSEAEAGFRLGRQDFSIGYGFNTGEDNSDGSYKKASLIIPYTLTFNYGLKMPWSMKLNLNGRYNAERQYPKESVYEGETLILLNTMLSKSLLEERLKVSVGGTNILNRRPQNLISKKVRYCTLN